MNKNLLSFLDGAKLACVKANKAPIAQLVEQRTLNPWVVGSIPAGGTQSLYPWKALKNKALGIWDLFPPPLVAHTENKIMYPSSQLLCVLAWKGTFWPW